MLGVSRKLLYAVEAVVDVAYNGNGEPVQSSEITRRQGIPRRYLEPVLQHLVRSGILDGVRGPRGGYRLARERSAVSLGDITRVVADLEGGPDPITEPCQSDLGRNVVRPTLRRLRQECMDALDQITIDDLCVEARGSGVKSDAFQRLDYSI